MRDIEDRDYPCAEMPMETTQMKYDKICSSN